MSIAARKVNTSKYTLENVLEMLAERETGVTYANLALKWNCSKTHMREMLTGSRGPLKPRVGIQIPKKGANTRAKAQALFKDGHTKKEIATRLNISEGHCATLIVTKEHEKRLGKDAPFHGENEPNWPHELSATWLSKRLGSGNDAQVAAV